jgi:predicted permease
MLEPLRAALTRARALLQRRRLDREMDDEFRFHLEIEIAHNLARGMPPAEAQRAAALAFGGVERYRDATREARGVPALEALARDARLALRRLRRAPAFTLGVTSTLAVGLGAATGIGALVSGVLLRPLPYPAPDRLVRVSLATPGLGMTTTELSSGTFVYFAGTARSFSALGAYTENEGVAITEGETPERVTGAIVTANLFDILGTRPAAGRLLRDDDAFTDGPVLIGYDLWQRRYGGDPGIVGRAIELNRWTRLVVGVLPRGFDFPSRAAAVYYAERIEATRADLNDRYLTVVGRLAPGVTVGEAQAEAERLAVHLPERFPELSVEAMRQAGVRVTVQTLRGAIVAPVRTELVLLAILIGVLVLIATSNVATLCLLRAGRLRQEVAVSRALGASRTALTQRFVVEGLVVALAGGLLGLPIATLAIATRFGFRTGQIPRLEEVGLTPVLIGGLLAVATLIGLLLGLVAAARAGDGTCTATLGGLPRSTPGRGWRRAQEGLVAAQIALALALLVGAGLVAGSLSRLRRVDIGFSAEGRTKFALVLPFRAYPTYQRVAAFHLGLLDALRHLPGVTAAGAAMQFPATPQLLYVHPTLESERGDGRIAAATVTANIVSPQFFQVMGIPLRAGRTFSPGDLATPTPGVVLSASLARALFGAENPLGQEVRLAASVRYPPYRVIGISGDVYGERVTDGALRVLYFPLLGDLAPASSDTARIPFVPAGMHFVVRSELPLARLTPLLRQAVRSLDPRVPIWDVRTLRALVGEATARTRLTLLLLGVAALGTLALGAIGLYSVIAYAVAGRVPDFAVRLALGAQPRGIMRSVFRDGALVAAVGIVAGLGLAAAGARTLRTILYGVGLTEPAVYAGAGLVVLLVSAAATYVPARRAGHCDPARVLRGE